MTIEYKEIIDLFLNKGINVVDIKYISAGSYGKVVKCFDDEHKPYALKIYFKEGIVKNEVASLNELSKNKAIHIPQVYFYGLKNDRIQFDYLCMEFINGKNALFNLKLLFAPKSKKQAFANSVVDSLLDIHNIHSDKFGNIENPQYDNWIEYYRNFVFDLYDKAIQKNKDKQFDTYVLNSLTKAISHFDDIFCCEIGEPTLIHGDLNVMNIMVDDNLIPVAFIDPLNTMFADREYDLFQLKNLTGNVFRLYELYKQKYPVSKNCDIKCAFYALFNEAMVYIKTGRYTRVIMLNTIHNMNKELRKNLKPF